MSSLRTKITASTINKTKLTCPACQQPIRLTYRKQIRTVVCPRCATALRLTDQQPSVLGQTDQLIRPDLPLKLGMTAQLNSQTYQLIGWMRYEGWVEQVSRGTEVVWHWDQFQLVDQSGQTHWLSYQTDDGFLLEQPITPRTSFDPRQARFISLDVGIATVTGRGSARILAMAGALTWAGQLDDEPTFLEARKGRCGRYSIEYSAHGYQLIQGHGLDTATVCEAFQIPRKDWPEIDPPIRPPFWRRWF